MNMLLIYGYGWVCLCYEYMDMAVCGYVVNM